MQVLLLKDVPGLGHAGDVKGVAGGYAMNYLIPRKLAAPVTEGTLKQAASLKEAEQRKNERQATEVKALADRLQGRTVVFRARAGEGERLYGSITGAEIAQALSNAIGRSLDRRLIDLEHPIKTLGEHKVTVKLGGGVSADVYVSVERAAEEAEPKLTGN